MRPRASGSAGRRSRWGYGDWTVFALALFILVELLAFANLYGYGRDELYFIEAGGHPAFGYPDQPPLVPLICKAMFDLGNGSLVAVRLPSAIAAALIVVIAALIAREVGGGQVARVVAAATVAVSAVILATGHFVTTTTFDLLSTSLLGWLVVRSVVRHNPRLLIVAGVVVGVGFEAKPQIAVVAAALLCSAALLGPRWIFRSGRLWLGVTLAAAIAAPYVIWQAVHGWPQIEVAHSVAGSVEGGRLGFVPFQLVLVSPFLVPVWIAGLVAPFRHPRARVWRFVSVAFSLVAAAYLLGNGKAYYLASLYPLVIGLGAISVERWLNEGRPSVRWTAMVTALGLSAALSAYIALPLLPPRDLPRSLPFALNPDLGETVGWTEFDATVATVWRSISPTEHSRAIILTENYGEGGAISVLGRGDGLPNAYSTNNGFGLWGPPPADATTILVVGYDLDAASAFLDGCRVAATITNSAGVENQEHGKPVLVCSQPSEPWNELWPRLIHYD